MSIKDYLDTIALAPAWLKQSWQSSKRSRTSKLSMRDIDSEIRPGVSDADPGDEG